MVIGLGLVFATGNVSAKSVKVPKKICYTWDLGEDAAAFLAFSLKKGGKNKFGFGKVDYYAVQGLFLDPGDKWPTAMTGTSFVLAEEEQVIQIIASSSDAHVYDFEIYHDLDDDIVSLGFTLNAGEQFLFEEGEVVSMDCKEFFKD